MSSVRLHKASVVGHDNHLVAVNGNLDGMLEPRIQEVEHNVLLTICFDDLQKRLFVSARADIKAAEKADTHLVVRIAWRTFLIRQALRLDAALLIKMFAVQSLKARLAAMDSTLACT